MFKFLKNKIKDAVDKFKKSAQEELEEDLEATEDIQELEGQEQQPEELTVESPPEAVLTEVEPAQELLQEKPKVKKLAQPEELPVKEPEPEPREEEPRPEEQATKEEEHSPEEIPQSVRAPESTPEPEPVVLERPEVEVSVEVEEELPSVEQSPQEELEVKKSKPQMTSKPQVPSQPESEPVPKPSIELKDDEDLQQEYEDSKKGFLGRLFSKKKSVQEELAQEELEEAKEDEADKIVAQAEEDVLERVEEVMHEEEPQDVAKPAPPPIIKPPQVQPVQDLKAPSSQLDPSIEPDKNELAREAAQDVLEVEKEELQMPPPQPEPQTVAPSKLVKEAVHKELLDEDITDATQKKKGFFSKVKERVVRFKLTEEKFEEVFWEFEMALMENNVAVEVIEKIKKDMHDQLTQENVSRRSVEQVILDTLKRSIEDVLNVESFDLLEKIKASRADSQKVGSSSQNAVSNVKRPFVIAMIGVNGSGKTTTLAKLIYLLQKNNLSVVVAAADTFRAAAIQQLEKHTTKLGVKLIKHDYNADPAAVAFDAVKHATAQGLDVVLIDTAGRLQSNSNLMDELKKVIRVNKPDLNIFVGESITGNDCVEQAVAFDEAVGIDGIILSKADIDEKGGAALSVSYVTKKPILFIGTGQTYDDLKPFVKAEILQNLGL